MCDAWWGFEMLDNTNCGQKTLFHLNIMVCLCKPAKGKCSIVSVQIGIMLDSTVVFDEY